MGYDGKYGRITTERLEIPDDEPVFLFRGRDKNLPDVLRHYLELCEATGSPAYHADVVRARMSQVRQWQQDNADRVRTPDSRRLQELQDKEGQ